MSTPQTPGAPQDAEACRKPEHTPGPWEAVCLGSDGYYIYPNREHTKETLRERMRAFANVALDPDNPERSKANAQLIALAPEMAARLVALEAAAKELAEAARKVLHLKQMGTGHRNLMRDLAKELADALAAYDAAAAQEPEQ